MTVEELNDLIEETRDIVNRKKDCGEIPALLPQTIAFQGLALAATSVLAPLEALATLFTIGYLTAKHESGLLVGEDEQETPGV